MTSTATALTYGDAVFSPLRGAGTVLRPPYMGAVQLVAPVRFNDGEHIVPAASLRKITQAEYTRRCAAPPPAAAPEPPAATGNAPEGTAVRFTFPPYASDISGTVTGTSRNGHMIVTSSRGTRYEVTARNITAIG